MASGSLGRLSVDLLLETVAWASGLTKAEHEAKKSSEAIERSFNKLGGKITDSLKTAAAGLAAGFAVDRVFGFINGVQQLADSLDEMAQKTGTSVEFLAEMSVYAEMSGASVEALAGSMVKFNKATVEAFGNEGSKAGKVFKSLGIDIKDASGNLKPAEELSRQAIQALGELEDGAVKTALAMALFGKSGAELIPTFNSAARASDELKASTKAYKDEMAKLAPIAGALEEQQKIMSLNSKTLAATLGEQLIPYVTVVLKQWNQMSTEGSALAQVGTFLLNVFKGLVIVADVLITGFAGLIKMGSLAVEAFDLWKQGRYAEAFAKGGEAMRYMGESGRDLKERVNAIVDPMSTLQASTFKAKQTTEDMANAVKGAGKAFEGFKLEKVKTNMDALNLTIKAFHETLGEVEEIRKQDDALVNVVRDVQKAGEMIGMTRAEAERFTLANKISAAGMERWGKETAATRAELVKLDAELKKNNLARFGESVKLTEEALDDQIKTMGMAADELERYTAQKQYAKLATDLGIKSEDEYAAAVERLNKKLSDKQAKQNYLEFLNTIEGAWHQAFDSMFSDTDGGWKKMLESLKASFKKILLNYIYEAFAKPFMLKMVAQMMGGSVPSSMTGMSGTSSMLGSIFGGQGGGGGGGIGGTIMNGIASLFGGGGGGGAAAAIGADGFGMAAGYAGLEAGAGAAAGAAGGGLMGAAGGIMAGIGAAMPYVAIAMMVGNMLFGKGGMLDDPDAMRSATFGGSSTSMDAFKTKSAFGEFGISETHWFSDAEQGKEITEFLAGIKTMDDAFANLMSTEQVEATTARLAEFSKQYEFGMEHEATQFGKITQDRLGIIAEAFGAGLAEFVKASEAPVDELITIVESFARLKAGSTFDFEAAVESTKPQTMAESYDAQAEALGTMVENLDTSAESMGALTQGMYAFQQSTVQMLATIDAVSASIHGMFESTAEGIAKSVMSEEERYKYLQEQTDSLYAQLDTETDPAKIKEISEKINANIKEAWDLLDPEQQEAQAEEYLKRIAMVDAKVADRLKEVREDVVDTAEGIMADISTRLDEIFTKGQAAADTNLAAANTQVEAANTPVQVQVTVNDSAAAVNGG